MKKFVYLMKSSEPNFRYTVIVNKKTIHFGDKHISKGLEWNIRKKKYIKNHSGKDKWGISGIYTRGFWDRWLIWNLPKGGISANVSLVEKKFPDIKIIKSRMRSPTRKK